MAADSAPEPAPGPIPSSRWWTEIITVIREPLAFFTLAALALVVALPTSNDQFRPWLIGALLFLVAVVAVITVFKPAGLYRPSERVVAAPPADGAAAEKFPAPPVDARVESRWREIWGAEAPPPDLDTWYQRLRPTLHQASFYTVPTYYLDTDLYVLDYNIAFEVVFRNMAGRLRGRHVNWFIARLQNHDQVHEHGREFTDRVQREGSFPFVDLEPIVYESADFGRVEFTKVASQLHDASGRLQGWAVALMIRHIKWDDFEHRLEDKLFQDKLWSVYSGPYDRVLAGFPSYWTLIQDVTAVLPDRSCHVADLGAGTGNVTRVLLEKGHRVTAVENNLGMLDRLGTKSLGRGMLTIVKASIENIECLKDNVFDGVVMVNVLYAVDDPLHCLAEVFRILKPGGVLGFSTTHRDTNLDELLRAIKTSLTKAGTYAQLINDYDILCRVNRDIEKKIARRHDRAEYRRFVETTGFEVTQFTESTYHNAVMLVHARKADG
jgi:ubiquinone/menaquinone biosynthesis C-methylase UbiE